MRIRDRHRAACGFDVEAVQRGRVAGEGAVERGREDVDGQCFGGGCGRGAARGEGLRARAAGGDVAQRDCVGRRLDEGTQPAREQALDEDFEAVGVSRQRRRGRFRSWLPAEAAEQQEGDGLLRGAWEGGQPDPPPGC